MIPKGRIFEKIDVWGEKLRTDRAIPCINRMSLDKVFPVIT